MEILDSCFCGIYPLLLPSQSTLGIIWIVVFIKFTRLLSHCVINVRNGNVYFSKFVTNI